MNKKAVVMLSGGLDSTLAARIMIEQGIQLTGIYLSAPWGCCDKTKAMKVARTLGIDFTVVKMTQDYIKVIRSPKYGYGSAMNPCVDCRIYMFEKAKELMGQIGASFLVTGEVLGQRPMSQMRGALKRIEEDAGLSRLVLRPLSAKKLPVSLPEEAGVVNREALYGIAGRSRKTQMQLAKTFGILEYPNPAGGCLLTDQQFGDRVKDLFDHGADVDLEDMELLRFGRHFRFDDGIKLVVGRNEAENATLQEYLAPGRLLFQPNDFGGPSVLYLGPPNAQAQEMALKLIAHYTGAQKLPVGAQVICRVGQPRGEERKEDLFETVAVSSQGMEEAVLERMRV